MFGLFKKKNFLPEIPVVDEQLAPETSTMVFDETIEELMKLSPKAKATFLYRLVGKLPVPIVKTLHTYTSKRLGYDKNSNTRQGNAGVAGSVKGSK